MVGVGRVLWRSSSPTALLKQGHLKQVAWDSVQAGFESLQSKKLHNFSGQPIPVLCHPQSKEILPRIQVELRVFQFVRVACHPVAGQH